MAITLHSIASKPGSRVSAFRIGRGPGSGRGKTAGKGTKGQRSRTGGKSALKLKGMKQMLLSFPKNRGFRSRFAKDVSIRIERLAVFADGSKVTLESLRGAGLALRTDLSIKIIAGGELTKKLIIAKEIHLSAGAKSAIERAGGKIG